jgi:hypothetical protein
MFVAPRATVHALRETAKPNALTIFRYQVLGLFCSACIYSTCLFKTHMDERLPGHDQTQRVVELTNMLISNS